MEFTYGTIVKIWRSRGVADQSGVIMPVADNFPVSPRKNRTSALQVGIFVAEIVPLHFSPFLDSSVAH